MQPATMSLSELVLSDPEGTNEIVELRLWSPADVGEELRCSAMRLDLANGQKIFADPTYHLGAALLGRRSSPREGRTIQASPPSRSRAIFTAHLWVSERT